MNATGFAPRKVRPLNHTLIKRAIRKTETPTQWAVDMFVDNSYHYSYHEWMTALSELLNDDEFLKECCESGNAKLRALYMMVRNMQLELHRSHKDDVTIRRIAPNLMRIARLNFKLRSDANKQMDDVLNTAIKDKYGADGTWDLIYGWSEA